MIVNLPPGYAPATLFPRVNPQPPIKAPPPLPPQGSRRANIGAPGSKTGAPPQPPLIVKPIVQIYHSIFG